METVEKFIVFETAVANNLRTVFPRMEKPTIVINEVKRGMIAHVTVPDREMRVVEGEIMDVKVTHNVIVEGSMHDPNLYYIFDSIDGKFRIQFIFNN